ncbi:MAG: DoxX family protein [bacterium]|nr:DoxX family protein [bacterium]
MRNKSIDLAILILRVSLGVGMAMHGWGKYVNFSQYSAQFPDILGIGPVGNLALATFAELVCAVLVGLGLATRFAAIPIIFTMAMAFFIVHGADPFAKKEMAFLYLTGFTAVFFLGSGAYSLHKRVFANRLPKLRGWKAYLFEQ